MATRQIKRASRRYSTRDKLLTLAQEMTQARIAKKLGVSERTVRRWKNEGVAPSIPRAQKRLQSAFELAHKRVAAEIRRERRRSPGAPRIESRVRVLPRAARRSLDVYRRDPATGARKQVKEKRRDPQTGRMRKVPVKRRSEWLNYDVHALGIQEIFELVRALRDDERVIQLVYRIPKGSRYPRDARGRPGRVVKRSTRTGSPPLDLSNLDDGELMDFLLMYVDPVPSPKSRRIVYVSALDKKLRRERDEDSDEDSDE